jgi:uncharacterized membrane protein
MKPLFVLIIVFALSLAIGKATTGSWHLVMAGNIAMCCMLCFTALGHFKFTKGMVAMIPDRIPFRKALVYFTGMAELLLGVVLLFPAGRYAAGIILIILFLAMLPANINAANHHIDFESGNASGKGLRYLWFRIPLQLFFLAWVLYFAIYR